MFSLLLGSNRPGCEEFVNSEDNRSSPPKRPCLRGYWTPCPGELLLTDVQGGSGEVLLADLPGDPGELLLTDLVGQPFGCFWSVPANSVSPQLSQSLSGRFLTVHHELLQMTSLCFSPHMWSLHFDAHGSTLVSSTQTDSIPRFNVASLIEGIYRNDQNTGDASSRSVACRWSDRVFVSLNILSA